jgi:hypothetical protein
MAQLIFVTDRAKQERILVNIAQIITVRSVKDVQQRLAGSLIDLSNEETIQTVASVDQIFAACAGTFDGDDTN